MRTPETWLGILVVALVCSACSNNENAHTTATTFVSPPPRQVLKAEIRPSQQVPALAERLKMHAEPGKPVLEFLLPKGTTYREGEEVVLDFALGNAKLKGDGGEYRVRYIVDDDEMQWIDSWQQVVLTGWIAGKHTIRVELVGPDGWPYPNGDYNIMTREITVVK